MPILLNAELYFTSKPMWLHFKDKELKAMIDPGQQSLVEPEID